MLNLENAANDDRVHQQLSIAMVAPPWYSVPPPAYGGVETMCADLIDALVDRGHKVTLIGVGKDTSTSADFLPTSMDQGFPSIDIGLAVEVTHVAEARKLVQKGAFDLVHNHTIPWPLISADLATPSITTTHVAIHNLGQYLETLGTGVNAVAISHAQRAARPHIDWAGVVHNGISLSRFPFKEQGGDYVVWIGRFCEEKAPDTAIKICREAGVKLVMAGKLPEGDDRVYFDDVVQPLISPDVEILFEVPRDEIPALVGGARCLLHPVRWPEPFGMALIEAMASGTPVLGTNQGALVEVVTDGITGFLRDDPMELVSLISQVEVLDRAQCRKHVEQNFSDHAMALGYERVYRSVLGHVS